MPDLLRADDMNVLVTGGAGFIGSHLCDALLSRGHAVCCARQAKVREALSDYQEMPFRIDWAGTRISFAQ